MTTLPILSMLIDNPELTPSKTGSHFGNCKQSGVIRHHDSFKKIVFMSFSDLFEKYGLPPQEVSTGQALCIHKI